MPGLVGFFDDECTISTGKVRLKNLLNMLTHQSFYECDFLFMENGVYGSRPHKTTVQKEPQPFSHKHLHIWFDGEIYNRDSFYSQDKLNSDPAFIASLYLSNENFSFFKKIDGIFSCVIYDTQNRKIHFITDRFGFKLLYYFKNNDRLTWFSEAKGALSLDDFSPKIDKDSVFDFFNEGYLTGNKSWFKGVELFPPASVVSWDISKKKFTSTFTYWNWNELKKLTASESEILDQFGVLFNKAVQKRANPLNKTGILLSGGLDSRAILASIPKSDYRIHTYTFGKHNCWDIKIAEKVSEIKNALHHVHLLNANNWIDNRMDAVWWTDGQFNLKHMHLLNLVKKHNSEFSFTLNGFLGDAIQGGYYLQDGEAAFKEKVNNRGRRFINEGPRIGEVFDVFYRRPFIDKDLLEFTLSLPVKLKKQSYLYNKMLLREFPEYFQNIAWQRTGYPISNSKLKNSIYKNIHAIRNKGINLTRLLGISITDNKHYHDYACWIREKSNPISKILQNSKAIFPEYLDREKVLSDWQYHLRGKDLSEEICAYLTFEIFLQQVFRNKYRSNV